MSFGIYRLSTRITNIHIGSIKPLQADGRHSAIIKSPAIGDIQFNELGIAGDHQADKKVHGGKDKAVHYYPSNHYLYLSRHFPLLATKLIPGALGENLIAPSESILNEETVCLGDQFRFGQVLLEVSQPRTPCWKIDTHLGRQGVAKFIAKTGLLGWYFRVIEAGQASSNDELLLVKRLKQPTTLNQFTKIWRDHQSEPELLLKLSEIASLTDSWRERLVKRAHSLHEQKTSSENLWYPDNNH